jgi:hypothetical protein
MTGEMSESEVTRERFPAMFRLKDEIRQRFDLDVEAKAFDQYQGPYLLIDRRIKVWMHDENGWKHDSLRNDWYFEGVDVDGVVENGAGVYEALEKEGYDRTDGVTGTSSFTEEERQNLIRTIMKVRAEENSARSAEDKLSDEKMQSFRESLSYASDTELEDMWYQWTGEWLAGIPEYSNEVDEQFEKTLRGNEDYGFLR